MNRNYSNDKKKVVGPKEEYAYVLDVVSVGGSFSSNEVVQAIGETSFTLFELIPRPGVNVRSGQRVYIGDGKRDEIQYIKRILFMDKLSSDAASELPFIIADIVKGKEEYFVKFFNTAGAMSIRRHALEIIPGIGKKYLKDLLEVRDEKPFESFVDIKTRCPFLSDPVKAISERIVAEMEGETDIKFFVRRQQ